MVARVVDHAALLHARQRLLDSRQVLLGARLLLGRHLRLLRAGRRLSLLLYRRLLVRRTVLLLGLLLPIVRLLRLSIVGLLRLAIPLRRRHLVAGLGLLTVWHLLRLLLLVGIVRRSRWHSILLRRWSVRRWSRRRRLHVLRVHSTYIRSIRLFVFMMHSW